MDNYGEIHSFLAEAETDVDETGNLCYKIKDYDYAKLMQLRCFSCEELLIMHHQGIINMDMTLEEIKLIKKGGK